MSSAFLEIVELPDGRIVLRRSEEEEPLVTLTFSNETKEVLKERYIDVAKAMFHAGLQEAGNLNDEDLFLDEEDSSEEKPHILH